VQSRRRHLYWRVQVTDKLASINELEGTEKKIYRISIVPKSLRTSVSPVQIPFCRT
jgi:hypothetical protein